MGEKTGALTFQSPIVLVTEEQQMQNLIEHEKKMLILTDMYEIWLSTINLSPEGVIRFAPTQCNRNYSDISAGEK